MESYKQKHDKPWPCVSPTGLVHAVTSMNVESKVVTVQCNQRDGSRFAGYEHKWPLCIGKPITCKNCLRALGLSKHQMLDLVPGKIYKMTFANDSFFFAKVFKKTVHGEKMHSYFGIWPQPGYTMDDDHIKYGRYFWDYGSANQGRTMSQGMLKCREATEAEAVSHNWGNSIYPLNKSKGG